MAVTPPDHDRATERPERLLGSAMKCLSLVDALAAEPGPTGVSELARRLDRRRGTVHQQLLTLVAAGWVEPVPGGRYRLSLHSLMVGYAVLEQADLGSRILPTLTSLSAQTGETASVAVVDHDAALIIQRVAADRALKADIKPGTRMPLATSASGRALLSAATAAELDAIRSAGSELPDAALLDRARRLGHASQIDEYVEGMASIAVPIRGTKLGSIAVAITAPSGRYEEAPALAALETAAAEIGALLRG